MPPCGVYGRDVGLFAPSHVSIIALAAFIVEQDQAFARPTEEKRVLEAVRCRTHRRRNPPQTQGRDEAVI